MTDPLDHKFNIVPKPDPIGNLQVDVASDNALADFSRARATMNSILDVGQTAISELAHFASQAQLPESYDALSKMIKAVSSAAETSLKLHSQIEDLKKPEVNKDGSIKELHNHVHFPPMSTFEMKALLKDIKKDD